MNPEILIAMPLSKEPHSKLTGTKNSARPVEGVTYPNTKNGTGGAVP